MGECLAGQKNYRDALKSCQQSLSIYEIVGDQSDEYSLDLAKTLYHIGLSFLELKVYTDALRYLKLDLGIYKSLHACKRVTSNRDKVSSTINRCLLKLQLL